MPIVIHYTTEAGTPIRMFWTLDSEDEIRDQILDLYYDGVLSIKDRGHIYTQMMLARIKHREATNGQPNV